MLKFWKKKDQSETDREKAGQDEVAESVLESASPEIPVSMDETGEPAQHPTPQPDEASPPGWRKRLSGSGIARGLGGLFQRHPQLDEELLDELETLLITSDVGVNASTELVEDLRQRTHNREFADAAALYRALRTSLTEQLLTVEAPLDIHGHTPFVMLVVGVNGVGKTTTIGKLVHHYRAREHNVLMAAGDTFRAAAVEQLQTWGERNQVPVIAQGQGADSASVIFDALQRAQSRKTDLLVADTAGRLHTQSGLMDELGKIARVLKKLDPEAPHEVLMVIDGTTGQNAISQVRQFHQAIGVTGLVVTKLDGTAKGGVVFALAREFGLPIRFVGLGEGIADLRPFHAKAYVDGLLPAQPER
ncbi:signal recognition particle-docking protein FtsY [Oleiagrimonas sp.]|jgi:fused signal recognition particle receptor|uniref:signal recognition particle-docking protein FtsY n=1 Tax=Oleiagrimonas sp. TaxID=2010330 RepID=UPI00261B0D79|nr:signal recognition particle-docking protein FtsY [Oleiagrimonas sp.]MDA3915127.1 signal recognition particle-docking protein FtsY [Oleiagrimonas sp.]